MNNSKYTQKSLKNILFRPFLFLLLSMFSVNLYAQWNWYNPLDCDYCVVQNQGWEKEIGKSYDRLPQRAQNNIRAKVWNLSRQSAGLSIRFHTDAQKIKIRYKVKGRISLPHMPATGVSGIDLYSVDSSGKWGRYDGGKPHGDTICYNYSNISKSDINKEYRLYLPLYNSVEWLKIGIPKESRISFIPCSKDKPVVVYGTSIAQGACASRPGMAWTNLLNRSLGLPVINLGFSGNGRLEKEVISYINEIDACVYIIDCLPNLYNENHEFLNESEAEKLVYDALRQIRNKHSTPILLIAHSGYSNAGVDNSKYQIYKGLNLGAERAFEKLCNEGVKNIFYLSHEELNIQDDMRVDYVHPSDWGMKVQANLVDNKIREILKM